MPTLTGCSVCLKRALAIAKSFSRGSASIAIAAEFFWVSVMVVFMVACGLQKYTPCCKGLRLRIWVHTIYYQPGQLQEFRPPEGGDNLQLSPGRRPPRGRGSGRFMPTPSCCDRLTLRWQRRNAETARASEARKRHWSLLRQGASFLRQVCEHPENSSQRQ